MAVQVLAITSDLFLQSRIIELAKSLGANAKVVASEEALIGEANLTHPNLVILDLAASDYDPFLCAQKLKTVTPQPRMLALFPHIRKDLKLKAEKAMIDHIVPNSAFIKTLKDILEEEVRAN
jgi:PleD family two-component response regulator